MTKQQLIDVVASASDQPKAGVEAVLESLLGEIGKALAVGESIDLRGFGRFTIKDRAARPGRNPRTGEPIQIPARRSATFKPGKELDNRLAVGTVAAESGKAE